MELADCIDRLNVEFKIVEGSMKKCILICLFSFLLMPVVGGCARVKEIQVSEQQDGQTIQMVPGQIMVITLQSNPTTGYRWEFVDLDQAQFAEQGEAEFKSDSNLLGAGGVEIFRLKILETGEGAIHMIYHRSWEKNVPPIKEYYLFVSVQE